MGAIVGASITYRLAFGPNAGRKALTLQTVPVRTEQSKGRRPGNQTSWLLAACWNRLQVSSAQEARALVPLHHATRDCGKTIVPGQQR